MEAGSRTTPSPSGSPITPLLASCDVNTAASSQQCVTTPPIVATPRPPVFPTNTRPSNQSISPSFEESMRTMLDSMRADSKRLRDDNKSAIKTHREALARYNKAMLNHRGGAAELKRREKILEQRRRRVSRYEVELSAFQDKLTEAAESSRATSPFFETANKKYEDLLREQEALHRKEIDFAEFMKQQSNSEFQVRKLKVNEMRSRLASKTGSIRCQEHEGEISGVEQMTNTWMSVKESLDDDFYPADDVVQGVNTDSSTEEVIEEVDKAGAERTHKRDTHLRAWNSASAKANSGVRANDESPSASRKAHDWLEYFGLVERS